MTTVSLADVDVYRGLMGDLTDMMTRDINNALRGTSHLPVRQQQRYMEDAYPEIWTPYASSAGELAASWYKRSAPEQAYNVATLLLPQPRTVAGQVAWAFAQHAATHLLLAAAQRDLWNEFRQTISSNAANEQGAKWARHASANACRFCQMTATRGPVYSSKKTATQGSLKTRGRGDRKSVV